MQTINSICILRLSALGDICNLLPSIWQLRAKFPKAKIVWIIGKEGLELLKSVDIAKDNIEIILYDKSTGFKGMVSIWRKFKHRKFDVFCIMQTALRANILSLGIKAKIKLGYDWSRSKDGHYFFANRHIEKSGEKKVIEAYFDFLKYLGIKNLKWQWHLNLTSLNKDKFDFIDKKFFLLNPCSSSPKRDLDAEVYAKTLFEIWQKYKIIGVITGINSDYAKKVATKILTQVKKLDSAENSQNLTGAWLDITGKTSIGELWSLVAKSEFVISPDSAILHLAAAVNKPPIGLYANKNPDYTGAIFGDAYFVSKYSQAAEKYLQKYTSTGIYRHTKNFKKTKYKKLKFGTSIKSAQAMELIKAEDILDKVSLIILLKNLKQDYKK